MEYLATPKDAPPLNIPAGETSVNVRVIDSTSRITMPDVQFICVPHVPNHDFFHCPSFSFLISHAQHGHVLFDLGVRKGYTTKGSPFVPDRIKKLSFTVTVDKDVGEILDDSASETGVSSKDVKAVILSHHHWDHTGNVGHFPASTDIVVGPGFKKEYLPGYPTNPDSSVYEPDFEGKNIIEADIREGGLKLGRCEAQDYFGDGSLYLLSTPGHTVGHLAALARVAVSPPSFVLMIGDACHHAGELRPTQYLPLPKEIKPSPWVRYRASFCPGEELQKIHPNKSVDKPFYEPKAGFNHDNDEAERSMEKLSEFDATDNIITIMAHDEVLLDELPLFPKSINAWSINELDLKTRWSFTRDFDGETGARRTSK